MAVTKVTDTQSLNFAGGSSITYAHTVSAGSDLALTVSVVWDAAVTAITGITYAGAAMTLIGETAFGALTRVTTYGLVNPSTGTNNVIVTFDGTLNTGNADVSSMDYAGVLQTGGGSTFTGYTSQAGSGLATTVVLDVSSAVGDLAVAVTASTNDDHSATSQTAQWEDNSGSQNTAGATGAGAATVTFTETWTGNGIANSHNVIGFNIKAAGAGGSKVSKNTHTGFLGEAQGLTLNLYA